MSIKFETEDGTEVLLPGRMTVCPRCNGRGVHDNENFNGFTGSEDWADEDFQDQYRAGWYDVTCSECHGANVVEEVDEDACDPDLLRQYWQYLKDESDYRAEVAAERRMGA